jgi:RimJ/RimL family protein N-acetyltransferase
MRSLPERIEGNAVLLRVWRVDDAVRPAEAVAESAEHLQPWMAWTADEPRTPDQRRAMLARWESEWSDGGDAYCGIFLEDDVVGSCGLHHRLGPDALEIGYWIHVAFVRRGLATEAARLLTDAAFSMPEISSVEIHHDKANLASSGVPSRLGYRFVGEQPDGGTAPEDTGVECIWRIERSEWRQRKPVVCW